MTTKSVYLLPVEDGWRVKKLGKPGRIFTTKKDALAAARSMIRRTGSGQIVIYRPDGTVMQRMRFGLPKIRLGPDRSTIGRENIRTAIAHVIYKELTSE